MNKNNGIKLHIVFGLSSQNLKNHENKIQNTKQDFKFSISFIFLFGKVLICPKNPGCFGLDFQETLYLAAN
jgi:hypothetical protein